MESFLFLLAFMVGSIAVMNIVLVGVFLYSIRVERVHKPTEPVKECNVDNLEGFL